MTKIQLIVEGGKASASPQLAQTLGPMGVSIQEALDKINEATKAFVGIKVPVDVIVDEKTKDISVQVGSPPTSELIKKELNLQKGSGEPNKTKVGNIAVEQLIKIAKMKMSSNLERDLKQAVKTIAGSCNSLGILCEGKLSNEFTTELNEGKYDDILKTETTEVSEDKKKLLVEQWTAAQHQLEAQFANEKSKKEKSEEKKADKKGEKKEEVKEEKKEETKKK